MLLPREPSILSTSAAARRHLRQHWRENSHEIQGLDVCISLLRVTVEPKGTSWKEKKGGSMEEGKELKGILSLCVFKLKKELRSTNCKSQYSLKTTKPFSDKR